MKKGFLFFTVLIAMLFIFSCSSDENQTVIEDSVNKNKINDVMNLEREEDQKIAYLMLNDSEKYELWKQKLNGLMLSNELNKKQKELIKVVLNNVDASFFTEKRNDKREYFKTIIFKKLILDITKEFSQNQIRTIFYSVTSKIDPGFEDGGSGSSSCNCSASINEMFNFCGGQTSCKAGNCNYTASGCGFMSLSSCTGTCR